MYFGLIAKGISKQILKHFSEFLFWRLIESNSKLKFPN